MEKNKVRAYILDFYQNSSIIKKKLYLNLMKTVQYLVWVC